MNGFIKKKAWTGSRRRALLNILSPSRFLFIALDFLFKHKKLFFVLLTAGFIALGFSVNHRSKRVPPRTDFTVFIHAAETLKEGKSIYQMSTSRSWRYVYFPLLAILLMPFTHLPFLVNVALWYMLSIAAFLGTFQLAARLFPNPRDGLLAAGAAIVMCLPTIFDSFTRGQLGILSLFLAVAVYYLYEKNNKFLAGALLAFAVTLKFSPLLILGGYFLFKREWRVCLGAFLGFLFFILIFPSFIIGFEHNISLLKEYRAVVYNGVTDTEHEELIWHQLVTPFAGDNQSLYAALTRLFWHTDEAMKGHSNLPVHAITLGFAFAALCALFVGACRKTFQISAERKILEYGFFPVLMLLAAPVAEMHHYTLLFLLFLPAFVELRNPATTHARYAFLESGIWLAGGCFLAGYLERRIGDYGVPVWGVLYFCFVLARPLFKPKLPVI